jgi:hypothetical protein
MGGIVDPFLLKTLALYGLTLGLVTLLTVCVVIAARTRDRYAGSFLAALAGMVVGVVLAVKGRQLTRPKADEQE